MKTHTRPLGIGDIQAVTMRRFADGELRLVVDFGQWRGVIGQRTHMVVTSDTHAPNERELTNTLVDYARKLVLPMFKEGPSK